MTSACTIVIVERRPTAIIRADAAFAELPQTQRTVRARLGAVLPSLNAGPVGAACTRWTPPVGGKLPMEIGMIVSRPFAARDGVLPSDLPPGRAAHLARTTRPPVSTGRSMARTRMPSSTRCSPMTNARCADGT